MTFLLTTTPPLNDGLSLDLNVLELMLFAFGLLVTVGVAITLYFVFSRDEMGSDNHRDTEGTEDSQRKNGV